MAYYDLDQLTAAIKDLEIRLHTYRIALIKNAEEIELLEDLKEILKDNIAELKRESIIAMASEYKKAKDDLKRTETRLSFLRIDRLTYEKAFNSQVKVMDFLVLKYNETVIRLQNNVIKVKFGRKDG